MKRLKDWRLLFLVGALFSYSLLLLTMINDFYELPSEGFSKEVYLRSYEKQIAFEAYDDRSFTAGKLESGFYLLLNDGASLVYETYSETGERVIKHTINEEIDPVVNISSVVKDDQLQYIFLTADALHYGAIDLNSGTSLMETMVDSQVDGAVLHGAGVVYQKLGTYFYFDGATKLLFEDSTIKQFDYALVNKDLVLTTISRDGGSFYTDFYQIDLETGHLNKSEMKSYITASAAKDVDHQMIVYDGLAKSMSIFRDNKTGTTYYKELAYALENPEDCQIEKFEMSDFPNFRYKSYDSHGTTMMLEYFTFVGKTELASADSTYRNLVEMSIVDGQKHMTQLTKMKKSHPTYDFFEISGEDYIVFNTVDRESQSSEGFIYFATSLPSVVKASNTMTSNDLKELIFGALTVIPAALAVGFIPAMGFLFPVIIVIVPLSMIKISWTEQHPEKLLRAAICVYALSILFNFYENASKIVNEMQVMSGSIPWHLHSIKHMYGMLIVTFALSYLAHKWFVNKKPDINFMVQFGILFICQSMFYIMLFHAYPLLAN